MTSRPGASRDRGILAVKWEHDRTFRAYSGTCRAARLALVGVAHGYPSLGIFLIDAKEAELQTVHAIDAARSVDDRVPPRPRWFVESLDGAGRGIRARTRPASIPGLDHRADDRLGVGKVAQIENRKPIAVDLAAVQKPLGRTRVKPAQQNGDVRALRPIWPTDSSSRPRDTDAGSEGNPGLDRGIPRPPPARSRSGYRHFRESRGLSRVDPWETYGRIGPWLEREDPDQAGRRDAIQRSASGNNSIRQRPPTAKPAVAARAPAKSFVVPASAGFNAAIPPEGGTTSGGRALLTCPCPPMKLGTLRRQRNAGLFALAGEVEKN